MTIRYKLYTYDFTEGAEPPLLNADGTIPRIDAPNDVAAIVKANDMVMHDPDIAQRISSWELDKVDADNGDAFMCHVACIDNRN